MTDGEFITRISFSIKFPLNNDFSRKNHPDRIWLKRFLEGLEESNDFHSVNVYLIEDSNHKRTLLEQKAIQEHHNLYRFDFEWRESISSVRYTDELHLFDRRESLHNLFKTADIGDAYCSQLVTFKSVYGYSPYKDSINGNKAHPYKSYSGFNSIDSNENRFMLRRRLVGMIPRWTWKPPRVVVIVFAWVVGIVVAVSVLLLR